MTGGRTELNIYTYVLVDCNIFMTIAYQSWHSWKFNVPFKHFYFIFGCVFFVPGNHFSFFSPQNSLSLLQVFIIKEWLIHNHNIVIAQNHFMTCHTTPQLWLLMDTAVVDFECWSAQLAFVWAHDDDNYNWNCMQSNV